MKKIDEQIQWYKQNADSLYDEIVSIELEKINSLYDRYEDHTNEIFVDEMIESFCKIIERQREKINDLKADASNDTMAAFSNQSFGHSFISYTQNNQKDTDMLQVDFQDDKQLQSAFTQYCLSNGTSSYTVNDYCSRIKKTWKSFEEDYKNGKLKDVLASNFPKTPWDGTLMNVYYSIETLGEYVKDKIAQTNSNRNWLNARAALNKFDEFRYTVTK